MDMAWKFPRSSKDKKPIAYLKSSLENYDCSDPLYILHKLIPETYSRLIASDSSIHDDVGHNATVLTLGSTLMKCIGSWLSCIDAPTREQRLDLCSVIFHSLYSVCHGVSDFQRESFVQIVNNTLADMFADVLDDWIAHMPTSSFTPLHWWCMGHVVEKSASSSKQLTQLYQSLWTHVGTHGNTDDDLIAMPTRNEEYATVLIWLLRRIVDASPPYMDQCMDTLNAAIAAEQLELPYQQAMHVSSLCAIKYARGVLDTRDDGLRAWFKEHAADTASIDSYVDVETFVNDSTTTLDHTRAYVSSRWAKHQVLSSRIPTHTIDALVLREENVEDQRRVLEHFVVPCMEHHRSRFALSKRGIFNQNAHDDTIFWEWCKHSDRGIRLLSTMYALRHFQPDLQKGHTFPNGRYRQTRPYGMSHFSKADKILSRLLPDLVPLWHVHCELYGSDRHDHVEQSSFLLQYYRQHFSPEHRVSPLDVGSILPEASTDLSMV